MIIQSQIRCIYNCARPIVSTRIVCSLSTELSTSSYINLMCKQQNYNEALDAFNFHLKKSSIQLEPNTYVNLILACTNSRSLNYVKKIHDHISKSKCKPDLVLQNHILNMYGKCGSLKDARKVFDAMQLRNVVSWTIMIAGYMQNGQENNAIVMYIQMLRSGYFPDQLTFGSIIKACCIVGDIHLGRQLHGHVIKSGYDHHLIAQNALILMYTKLGQIAHASGVFAMIPTKDLISWASMITGFTQLGNEIEALYLFRDMLRQGVYEPNEFIFGSVFSACRSLLEPEFGRQIHGVCAKFGLGRNNFAGCSLWDMYAKFGFLSSAKKAFNQIESPDLVSWNAIIAAFSDSGDANEVVSFFYQMMHVGLMPDDITFLSLLSACGSSMKLNQGMQMHYNVRVCFCTCTYTTYKARPLATSEQVAQIIALIREDEDDLGSKLNNMNVSLSHASVIDIFQRLASERFPALQFFDWLKASDPNICCDPDLGSLFVNNCGLLGNYEAMIPVLSEFSLQNVFLGMKAFGFLLDLGLDKASSMVSVKKVMAVFNEVGGVYQSCGVQLLIEMFGLSGSFEIAEFVIRTAGRKVKNYHVLMRIMCKRGDCKRVGDLVMEMERSGCDMNASTYNLLLSCLCKSGNIDEAWQVLKAMEKNQGISDVHSFDILINSFCKRHQFDLALKLIHKMALKGIEPSILTHAAVIKSYFESGKYEEAHEYVIGSAGKLSYSSNANYSLLATLHLKNGNVLLASKVISEMMDRGLKPNFSAYKKIKTHLEKKDEKALFMELSRR